MYVSVLYMYIYILRQPIYLQASINDLTKNIKRAARALGDGEGDSQI